MGVPQQARTLIIMCSLMLFSLDHVSTDERAALSNLLTRGLEPAAGGRGSRSPSGWWLWHHMPLKLCINFFLALGDGAHRMTASPVFNRSAICHDHAGCAHDSSEAFSAQPLWAKVRCAVAIVNLKSNEHVPKFPTEVDVYRQPKKYVCVPFCFIML